LSENHCLGRFLLEGLNQAEGADGTIAVRFQLTLDGILNVTAVEKLTGVSKTLKIDNALAQISDESRQAAVNRLANLFDESSEFSEQESGAPQAGGVEGELLGTPKSSETVHTRIDQASEPESKLKRLVVRAQSIRGTLNEEDGEDVDRLLRLIRETEQEDDPQLLGELENELDDLLFYLTD
jgi:molecular chaperone DnaK